MESQYVDDLYTILSSKYIIDNKTSETIKSSIRDCFKNHDINNFKKLLTDINDQKERKKQTLDGKRANNRIKSIKSIMNEFEYGTTGKEKYDIVDIGAGSCEISLAIKDYFQNSEVMVIDQKLPDPEKIKGLKVLKYDDHGRIPLLSGTVDIVIMMVVLHHMPANIREKIIYDVTRILKEGGLFIIREHNIENNPHFEFYIECVHHFWYIFNNETEDPLHLISVDELDSLCSSNGLQYVGKPAFEPQGNQSIYYRCYVRKNYTHEIGFNNEILRRNALLIKYLGKINGEYPTIKNYVPEIVKNEKSFINTNMDIILKYADNDEKAIKMYIKSILSSTDNLNVVTPKHGKYIDYIIYWGNIQKNRETILKLIKTRVIPYPYKSFYFYPRVKELFEMLCTGKYDPIPVQNSTIYSLKSYKGKAFMPPKYKDKYVTITYDTEEQKRISELSDYFTEEVRIKGKRHNDDKSHIDTWYDESFQNNLLDYFIQKRLDITPLNLIENITYMASQNTNFSPLWANALLKFVIGNNLEGKKLLDISAGWGDRLISAISLKMLYTGYDPNTDLIDGHSKIIKTFGDPNKHKVYYQPFESSTLIKEYDVILTSPPYFNTEIYKEFDGNQSTNNFPTKEDWLENFMFKSLKLAWDALLDNGYLILHIGDSDSAIITEPINIYIKENLNYSSYIGVIGVSKHTKNNRPVWIWQKNPSSQNK